MNPHCLSVEYQKMAKIKFIILCIWAAPVLANLATTPYRIIICQGQVSESEQIVLKISIHYKDSTQTEGHTIMEIQQIGPTHNLIVSYRGNAFKDSDSSYFFFWRGAPDFNLKLMPPNGSFNNEAGVTVDTLDGLYGQAKLNCQATMTSEFSIKDFDQIRWIPASLQWPTTQRWP